MELWFHFLSFISALLVVRPRNASLEAAGGEHSRQKGLLVVKSSYCRLDAV